MQIAIQHRTHYDYSDSLRTVTQKLRLTPSNHDGQQVLEWRIEPSIDGRLAPAIDPYGNRTHMFYGEGPATELTLLVTGVVLTEDRGGFIRHAAEPLDPMLYRRVTALTHLDPALHAFVHDSVAPAGDDPVAQLHALMLAIHRDMIFDAGMTDVTTTAAQAFALGHGVCQDFAHMFIAGARALGLPARYISGHYARNHGTQPAAHAWAEARVEGLGWIAFDPAHGRCPDEGYVRVACALDYLGAAPVRGARQGGGRETLSVEVQAVTTGEPSDADQAAQQAQQQQAQQQHQAQQ